MVQRGMKWYEGGEKFLVRNLMNLYSSPNTFEASMRWAVYVACIGSEYAYTVRWKNQDARDD
jgi:hypothetical protein